MSLQPMHSEAEDQLRLRVANMNAQHEKALQDLSRQAGDKTLDLRNALQKAQNDSNEQRVLADEASRRWDGERQSLNAEITSLKDMLQSNGLGHTQRIHELMQELRVRCSTSCNLSFLEVFGRHCGSQISS